MTISYTKQQQSVIDVRNRNVLVSAAAGSGKTAVLVERVIQMVLNQEISMNQLLVVTFTRAAASEMRERISDALNQALAENYRSEIREQLALLPTADITTIHSFCLKVIRENYSLLGLEPDFRIGDEAEIEILAEEAMEELLENEFEEQNPEFMHFARSFSTGIGDRPIQEIIRKVYYAAEGMAFPKKWLDFMADQLLIEDNSQFNQNKLFQILWQEVEDSLEGATIEWQELAEFTEAKEFAPFYDQTIYFKEIIQTINQAIKDHNYNAIYQLLQDYKAPVMPRNRKGIDPESLATVKQKIENLRSIFSDLQPYFMNNLSKNLEITANMHRISIEIKRLVQKYEESFRQKKKDQNLIDFNDIEHMALELLQDEFGVRTEVANRYRSQYQQVIIDEYQDTNEVQDRILELVSGAPENPNSFMVGDIKQSIYKFRQAKPEIFQKKYLEYGDISSDYAKIDMQENFRSRQEILKLINFIFTSIMVKEAAGIDYDEQAKFNFSKDKELDSNYCPKLLLIEKTSFQSEEESLDRETIEATVIAEEIVQLLQSGKEVYDKKSAQSRPIQIEDIAILMRSPNQAMSIYGKVFLEYGLPILVDEGKAYFMTSEVQTVVNYLRILDNPRDDMALLGVLCSAIFEFEPTDLALIRIYTAQTEFLFDGLKQMEIEFSNQEQNLNIELEHTLKKIIGFLKEYDELKSQSYYVTISELLELILEKSQYELIVAIQPNGKQRMINLNAFLTQVRLYEEKAGSNLFRFLGRLDQIKTMDLKFGEPVMEISKAARIMSIHKSKGLEFPVVFVAQLGKLFNIRDVSAPVVIKDEYGLVLSDVDYERRIIREGFQKPIFKTILKREILEEEQRLLYVALTRAREYLFLVGTVSTMEKPMLNWENAMNIGKSYLVDGFLGKQRSYQYLRGARSYLDFIMPALLEAEQYGLIQMELKSGMEDQALELDEKEFLISENQQQNIEIQKLVEQLKKVQDQDVEEVISFYPKYPYQELIKEKVTTSVSEQKKQFLEEVNYDDWERYHSLDPTKDSQGDEEGSLLETDAKIKQAAKRGTLYHKILAIIPYQLSSDQLPRFLENLVKQQKITKEELEMLKIEDFVKVMASSIWKRMQKSAAKGHLKREQPFIMAVPLQSSDILEHKMLQGVIDVFFEEEGGLILLDYKTDRLVGNRQQASEILKERYTFQMEQYKQALEKISGIPVKESYLYSISRQLLVQIDWEVEEK